LYSAIKSEDTEALKDTEAQRIATYRLLRMYEEQFSVRCTTFLFIVYIP